MFLLSPITFSFISLASFYLFIKKILKQGLKERKRWCSFKFLSMKVCTRRIFRSFLKGTFHFTTFLFFSFLLFFLICHGRQSYFLKLRLINPWQPWWNESIKMEPITEIKEKDNTSDKALWIRLPHWKHCVIHISYSYKKVRILPFSHVYFTIKIKSFFIFEFVCYLFNHA